MPIKFNDLSISTFHTNYHKLPVFLKIFLKILHYGLPIIRWAETKKKSKEVFRWSFGINFSKLSNILKHFPLVLLWGSRNVSVDCIFFNRLECLNHSYITSGISILPFPDSSPINVFKAVMKSCLPPERRD